MTDEDRVRLRGMTWDHPRGYDPLVACSRVWRERGGALIEWERRSLQAFESLPVAELAARYDLIVIDHPHVGQVTREGCLAPLDDGLDLSGLARQTVGSSLASYRWEGRLWALPIDAAAQVQSWRPDRLSGPLPDWDTVLSLAARGGVLCPLRPPHDLMTLFTLCGLAGNSPREEAPELFERTAGCEAYERLRELTAHLDVECFALDPIAVLERMAEPATRLVCAPFIYGYVSYSRAGAHPTARAAIAFADLAPLEPGGAPSGSALGGTGLAVSAHSRERAAAIAFARWVAGEEAQCGPYLAGGGQPAHRAAWENPAANRASLDFYRGTRASLENAWVRPRHAGYMRFQDAGAERLRQALQAREPAATAIAAINRLYREVSR